LGTLHVRMMMQMPRWS